MFEHSENYANFYERFEVNDQTGAQLTHNEVKDQHAAKITTLQQTLFSNFVDDEAEGGHGRLQDLLRQPGGEERINPADHGLQ